MIELLLSGALVEPIRLQFLTAFGRVLPTQELETEIVQDTR
jgi:hypothetical protein